jgi:hypothetical protein
VVLDETEIVLDASSGPVGDEDGPVRIDGAQTVLVVAGVDGRPELVTPVGMN